MIKIYKTSELISEQVFNRVGGAYDVSSIVADIIKTVRSEGDRALIEYCSKFDHAQLEAIEVSQDEMDSALRRVDPSFYSILEQAAENIRFFHEKQVRQGFIIALENGVVMGQKVTPLSRVGMYVPGGTAAYPSTVLMDAIPAKIAGCPELIMTTPPLSDGSINPNILAAAHLAGVDRIFKTGGAQAIAAMAYGTETIPRVDKIVGPGNAYVTEAKRQVFGQVAIDMIAGPSEILIIGDGNSNPRQLAADLLSQAEHDKLASAVLITDSDALAEAVSREIAEQLVTLPRRAIAEASIEQNGKIIVAESLDQAIEISNELAPEHLELCVDEPFEWLGRVRNAGSVFLGRYTPEALGDYMAGPNHTLPTAGTARFYSPLSVDDFVKKTQYTAYTERALASVADQVAAFAEAEGLSGHARSVMSRSVDRSDVCGKKDEP
ncbi:MAG: histidinol dehydrogenase [Clostridia bacterium]|nr:histidinol dehydrogenase [Clostridia bacterium]